MKNKKQDPYNVQLSNLTKPELDKIVKAMEI